MLSKRPLIIDAFAGGGGASVGIEMALGRPVDIAINHDPDAILMHQTNHPETLHLTEDIFKVDLKKYIKGQRVALMWASPDCTSHSKAKGGKPRERGLRILPWAVYKHAKAILPEVIIMENVEEIQQWGPLDEAGYPIKERKGEEYRKFITAMKSLGYIFESRELSIRSEDEKEKAKKELGIDVDQKLILVTNAQWQSNYRNYERAVKFVEKAEEYFQAILEELSNDYHVVVIGKEIEEESNIHYLPSVPPAVFDQYINATDLFLSRNIISTSFAKMILMGVQGVVLINSSETEEAYKCKMFPVGWYDYIAPLESKSMYFQCFKQYEMFDQVGCIGKIKELLFKQQNQKKLQEYHERLRKLKNAQDIFTELEGRV